MEIDWANGPYFVKTEIDPAGRENYGIVGVSQLLSVPYAIYAQQAQIADTAAMATVAETALIAEHSISADTSAVSRHAVNADTATVAFFAAATANATNAVYAQQAQTADTAAMATVAATALIAEHSTTACDAEVAEVAQIALSYTETDPNFNAWKNTAFQLTSADTAVLHVLTNTANLKNDNMIRFNGTHWVATKLSVLSGGSQDISISVVQPYLTVNFVIALSGIFPSRNSYDPLIGEIMMVGFNFAPKGWALCDGQLLLIAENTALFSLLGTMYGGNGTTTFALPDLRGRVPVHSHNNKPGYDIGNAGGEEVATAHLPLHGHIIVYE
jgi:microcystin-dependent protein